MLITRPGLGRSARELSCGRLRFTCEWALDADVFFVAVGTLEPMGRRISFVERVAATLGDLLDRTVVVDKSTVGTADRVSSIISARLRSRNILSC